MGRLDALRQINRDADLKDEILARISDDPDLVHRLKVRAPAPAPAWALEAVEVPASAAPPRLTVEDARAVIEDPEAPSDPGLEAIILVMGRPVLLVRDDDFDLDVVETDTWTARLEQARTTLRTAIRSVGRIELDHHPQFDWVGTGWIVADDVVVTNRHVAEIFAHHGGDGFTFRSSFQGRMGARCDFREEFNGASAAEFRIAEVLHVEDDPGPDLAFLRIDWASNAAAGRRAAIPLAASLEPSRSVAVIGYPAKDTRTRISAEMDRIFGEVYNVKRLAPGEVTALIQDGTLITHDCTTLGGNSGSVVLDLQTGEAAALHFSGREADRNFAVAAPVVRAHLERLVAAGSAAGPVATPPVAAASAAAAAIAPEAPTLQELEGRDGFDPDFLGPRVGHPVLSPRLADVFAPVIGRPDGILDYTHYSVRMHRFRRLALYTAVNIDGAAARNVRRGRDQWSLDPRIDPRFQVGNELYERNKLDRGHLVRRLDPAWGESLEAAEAAALDTFFYTNCAPQHEIHNQQLWLGIEDHILTNADVHDLKVSVFSGPVFRDGDRRYRDLLIPEDFWKVVAIVNRDNGQLSATGYLVSQRDLMDDLEFAFGAFKTYQVPVRTIEDQTGLDFGALKDFDPLAKIETFAVRALTALEQITL